MAAVLPRRAGLPPPAASSGMRGPETAEETQERRVRESMRVKERVADIRSESDWQREMSTAGNKLVVLEVGVCRRQGMWQAVQCL